MMATAWLGATTGLSSKRSRTSPRAAIWGRSVASGLCASSWRAAIDLELARPDGAAGKGGGDERDPLLGGTPVPPAAALLRHGDERPVGAGFHTGHNPR